MSFLEQGFQSLVNLGVFEVFLPFILIFAIVFGIMTKVKIFDEKENRKFAIIIGLVMGLVSVFQHTMYRGSQFDVIEIINKALPQVSLVLVAIVMLFLMLGMFGKIPVIGDNKASGWVMTLALLIILYIFGSSAGFGWWSMPYWLQDYQTWSIVVVLLVFGLIIGYITGDDNKKKDPTVFEELSKLFGGGKKE